MTGNRKRNAAPRSVLAEQRKIDQAKEKLLGLSGENAEHAFREVRLLHDQQGKSWLDSYQHVINELTEARKREGK